MEPVIVPKQVLLTKEWKKYLNNELPLQLTKWLV
jgi:hypothetical protein